MVLVWFKDGEVVKPPVNIILSDTCMVEGVSFPVPTMFAMRYLLPGVEEAWRLLEEVDRAPFAPEGKRWVFMAQSLEEARVRLEEGLRNASNSEPRFYESCRSVGIYRLELSDGNVCYSLACDFEVDLPPNIYNHARLVYIPAVLTAKEYERVARMPREFFAFLGNLTDLGGKRRLRRSVIRALIREFALDPDGARQHLRKIAESIGFLNERDRLFDESCHRPLRFSKGFAYVPYGRLAQDGWHILLIVLDDGKTLSAKYKSLDSLKNAIYRLVKLGKVPRHASEADGKIAKATLGVVG